MAVPLVLLFAVPPLPTAESNASRRCFNCICFYLPIVLVHLGATLVQGRGLLFLCLLTTQSGVKQPRGSSR